MRRRLLGIVAVLVLALPAAMRAHPTAEHFLPLFVALGAAGAAAAATRFYTAIDAGVLSMDAYRFD